MEELLEKTQKMEQNTLDKDYIKDLVQDLLNSAHSDPLKRKIVPHIDKLNFACPICGDSLKHSHKKRGNLYFKNMYYVCYNDSSCSRSFTKLLKTFNIEMGLDEKLKLYDYLENNVTYFDSKDVEFNNFDKLFNIDELTEFYKDKKYRHVTKLRPLQVGSVVYNYIKDIRKVQNTQDIYEAEFYITEKWMQPVMVYMNKVKDKVVSFQVRNLLDGDKRIFKIYDFSKIWGEMHPGEELDDQEKISFDKLSHFFNIFRIDFTNPVNFFEGYIDSLFLPNSIGLVGVNTDMSFLIKEEGLDLRFIYDNDKAGFKKSRTMIEQRKPVFLWNKLFLDMIKQYKGKLSKEELIETLENIKDFNMFQLKFKKAPVYKLFDIEKYFSMDELDIYYLMSLKELAKTI